MSDPTNLLTRTAHRTARITAAPLHPPPPPPTPRTPAAPLHAPPPARGGVSFAPGPPAGGLESPPRKTPRGDTAPQQSGEQSPERVARPPEGLADEAATTAEPA